MSRDLVKVRALRPHDTTEGMKSPGDEYERTKADADVLQAAGVVERAPPPRPARKAHPAR